MPELKRNLKWICVFAAVIATSLAIIVFRAHTAPQGKTAKILSDSETVRIVDLENVIEPYEFTVTAKNGGENTIRVEKGKIAVVEASCPDKICMGRGFIIGAEPPIVCLPNRLSVVVDGDGNGVDAIVGGDAA